MDFSQISYDKDDGVATITLSRPARLNAYTWTMDTEIREAMIDADRDESIGAIVITGVGRAFCSGLEMEEMENISGTVNGLENATGRQGMFVYMTELRKPVIGALNGYAVGVGFSMTLFFDIRIAGESAKLCAIFVQRGLSPEVGVAGCCRA